MSEIVMFLATIIMPKVIIVGVVLVALYFVIKFAIKAALKEYFNQNK